MGDLRGRESKCTGECTALEEECQLAERHLERFLFVSTPKRRKASALESLLVDAQTCPVPTQYFCAGAASVREEKQIPGERVSLQFRDDQRIQAIVLLAHVDGPRVREHADAARQAYHASSRRSCAAS